MGKKEVKSTKLAIRITPSRKKEFQEYCETMLGEKSITKVINGFINGFLDTKKKILEKYEKIC